ncbi:PREDICTED: uncharacterized protein LOC105507967 [Colobus angolensis palliatus]|uniref:uncharacterized protein LOC105507967 n=1 Tax=Colobus angolensis palliatus TaxID=336983 RepID=UPI0005F50FFD|nr:PREDICTED: uncharacterized protein LOC105507967 [Colobus angolensis palliatus]
MGFKQPRLLKQDHNCSKLTPTQDGTISEQALRTKSQSSLMCSVIKKTMVLTVQTEKLGRERRHYYQLQVTQPVLSFLSARTSPILFSPAWSSLCTGALHQAHSLAQSRPWMHTGQTCWYPLHPYSQHDASGNPGEPSRELDSSPQNTSRTLGRRQELWGVPPEKPGGHCRASDAAMGEIPHGWAAPCAWHCGGGRAAMEDAETHLSRLPLGAAFPPASRSRPK